VVGGPRGLAGPGASSTWEYWDGQYLRVRPGLVITLHDRGAFWLQFAGGALYSNRVYASLVDGAAISGPADNCEATPFFVCSVAQPGKLAIVSSVANFGA
jgi:hypothetical protein